jgi:hypothetical protein
MLPPCDDYACLVQEMFAFPCLQDVFRTIADNSSYTLCLERPLAKINRRGSSKEGGVVATDAAGNIATFDDVVFACDAGMQPPRSLG